MDNICTFLPSIIAYAAFHSYILIREQNIVSNTVAGS